MEVLEVRSVKLHKLLLVKGSIFAVPAPFEWEGRVPVPDLNLMVLAPDGLLHLIEVPETRKVWDGDPKAILAKVNRETAVLRWPCKPGDSWASQGGRKRKDSLYCWLAEDWFAAPEVVKGWVAQSEQKALTVSYKSGPDNQSFAFVPGLGITRFDSSHHGDVAEFSAELVQVRGLGEPVR
jgi:hypothetical protein